jgi:hypothetical protein
MRRQAEIREAELARSIPGVSFSGLRNVVAKAEALEAGEVALPTTTNEEV